MHLPFGLSNPIIKYNKLKQNDKDTFEKVHIARRNNSIFFVPLFAFFGFTSVYLNKKPSLPKFYQLSQNRIHNVKHFSYVSTFIF